MHICKLILQESQGHLKQFPVSLRVITIYPTCSWKKSTSDLRTHMQAPSRLAGTEAHHLPPLASVCALSSTRLAVSVLHLSPSPPVPIHMDRWMSPAPSIPLTWKTQKLQWVLEANSTFLRALPPALCFWFHSAICSLISGELTHCACYSACCLKRHQAGRLMRGKTGRKLYSWQWHSLTRDPHLLGSKWLITNAMT